MLFLGRTLDEPPNFLNSLSFHLGIKYCALQPIWEGLNSGLWVKEELLQIQEILGRIQLLEMTQRTLDGKRCSFNAGIENLRHIKEKGFLASFSDLETQVFGSISRSERKWLLRNQVPINRVMLDISESLIDPVAHRFYPRNEIKAKALLAGLGMPADLSFLEKHIYLGMILTGSAETQAAIDQAWIACQLELHMLEHNQYPKALGELEADLPTDITTGKSYHYSLTEDGRYKLWSLAWNQTDEGGKLMENYSRKNNADDWVWQYTPAIAKDED